MAEGQVMRRIGRLDSQRNIAKEMRRNYRDGRSGAISITDMELYGRDLKRQADTNKNIEDTDKLQQLLERQEKLERLMSEHFLGPRLTYDDPQ